MLLLGVALAAAPPPIVNGETTQDFPGVVLLYATDAGGNLAATCTGTIIASGWVLTAAHCLADDGSFSVDQLYVMFVDRLSQASGSNSVLASAWIAHPDYDPVSAEHDVGLVQFDGGGEVVPVYDTPPAATDEGRSFTIVGFGATSETDTSTELTKREASVPLKLYDETFYYTDDPSQNACFGDSGGPLFRVSALDGNYAIVGVMNWVTACTGGSLASGRIDQQLDFIEAYVTPTYADAYGDGPGLRPADEVETDEVNPVEPNPVACGLDVGGGQLAMWAAAAAVVFGRGHRKRHTD